ncbi:CDP-diacylglycerol--serine O-phosphatidyltransferase [Campylobacter sp. MIT 97-5078]|uniref:CDP-diacylglycerol--serine O-phosphatidyltransferase n=1 Tax=Campylobacter sp. MIT 97-5078 TaxID=1548153 RepID=UPI0005142C0C|nr:CDP-diacylglycerol--serine O-phosphatidyltransferase [Campylobacter sp. MIT 97-5078]KGI55197.1 CDP-diacylglycerol--serine O-phosphatidyltransferase [Campylobacter sp. MIT 97-5078]TQR26727.1 CDP-diacylglycerol--serine O-phosphatidyltransferase [Campylobacter sp. MIT 97-5078]TQR26734.1 CDP-diacylglycerol--serine O-phosphatidyltransferase [Campylobacter sp. MIT 97-5078]
MQEHKPQLSYILPNLFTAASCFCGVISIISSINSNFKSAVFYIFLALVFDGLDGRIARLTNTTSKFGVEFDSLADLVAFGVAPAVLFYASSGYEYGKIGSLITGFFIVFGAIRLARFNVTTGTYEPSVFIGLPIPTAAIVSAIYTYAFLSYEWLKPYEIVFLCLQLMLAFLMVSNIRYPSFKKIDLSKSNMLKVLVLLILVFSMLYLFTFESILLIVSVYVFYGIVRAIWNLLTKFKRLKKG